MSHPTKETVRQRALQRRSQLTEQERHDKSERLCKRLQALPCVQKATHLGLYSHFRSEVETEVFATYCFSARKRVSYPKVFGPRTALELEFIEVQHASDLTPGFQGILEPSGSTTRLSELDLILMPGVAFGEDGSRIGYGAGTYDRSLSQKSEHPLLIGIGFEVQLHEKLPCEPHDMRVHLVVTEERTLAPSSL